MTGVPPRRVGVQMTKLLRPVKGMRDWSQNIDSKTTIAPYALRGADAPLVAAPRKWAEIERGAEQPGALRQLDMNDVLARLNRDGDLFALTLSS